MDAVATEEKRERPDLPFVIGGLATGALVWLLFGLAPLIARGGVMSACSGRPTGWPEHFTAAIAAGAIGLSLLAVSSCAAWLNPQARRKAIWGFPLMYPLALLVFCLVAAPAIWGPPGCGEGPPLFSL